MSGPDLSRRLGRALGTHDVSPEERDRIVDAAANADTWADLPADIRRLVEAIEARPGGYPPRIQSLIERPPHGTA